MGHGISTSFILILYTSCVEGLGILESLRAMSDSSRSELLTCIT